MSAEIESAIDAKDWGAARVLIEVALEAEPDSHWLITRLGLTYYEQCEYEVSLQHALAALAIVPDCPLALWDCAGSLDMLNRYDEAMAGYRKIIDAGERRLAVCDCGEGIDWARSLISDSHFRLGDCLRKSKDSHSAIVQYERYLELRQLGWGSIYDEADARQHISDCLG